MGKRRNLYPKQGFTEKQLEIRELAMADTKAFVSLVAPHLVLGHCHYDLLDFFCKEDSHQLALWPRAHLKSTMIAYWCAQYIIKNPDTTILYASDTITLATMQLNLIKNILTSDVVTKYWPGLINTQEGQRELWRQDAFSVDHWKRKEEFKRDPTVMAAGIGKGITGAHFDIVILDDVVVYENSNTVEERRKCATWYSLLSSILNPGGSIKGVGTRYDPKDLYNDLINMKEAIYDEYGEEIGQENVYTISENVVEIDGEFLWPRRRRSDGKWFGFNRAELAKKKAQYLDKVQFHAQYYNDPSDPDNATINSFEYYDREYLASSEGRWRLGDRKLNVFAAIDFASTLSKKSDYTCIVVIGVDANHNIYILDIDRFKTDRISEMQSHLVRMYSKWRWLKLRGEATASQNLIVNQIKEFNRERGIFYPIDIFKPTTDKEIRIRTNLEPRYSEKTMYHYRGGNCQLLEDELIAQRPPHDDIKDALASVVEIAQAPSSVRTWAKQNNIITHPKFGGVAYG